MNESETFVTPEGCEVRIGPQFQALFDETEAGLAMSPDTPTHKWAKRRRADVERAAEILLEAAWRSGEHIEQTP